MIEQEWVLEAIKFYRPLNFFEGYSGLTDEQLAIQLIARNEELTGQSYVEMFFDAKAEAAKEHEEWEVPAPEAIADMNLIGQDINRVWWQDGETEIYPGAEIYSRFLQQCSHISRGAFYIGNIEEEWNEEVLEAVAFNWNGARRQVFPNEMYGWIDFDILEQMNEHIRESGYKFFPHWTGDQTTFIVVLSEEENKSLNLNANGRLMKIKE